MFGPSCQVRSSRPDVVGSRGRLSWASSDAARNVMRANRKRDTGPELRLRRHLHRLGLRYRLGRRIAATPPVIPDLVFVRARVAVFVDGCFWHGCPTHGVQPRVNASYWSAKISLNKRRDRVADQNLVGLGWQAVRIWEHEDASEAAAKVEAIVRRHAAFYA
ncbi:MAG: DNA mismatch endonuclease Vsr [Candidatus Dormibacteraceae bacterium]